MNSKMDTLWLAFGLAVIVGALAAVPLMAQQATPSGQPTAQSSQRGQDQKQEPGQSPARAGQPDSQSQAQQGVQTFTGTIVKSGTRFMLQDSSTGKTYDIDNQEAAKPHEGRQVTIKGTLDPDGKTIHVK